MHTILSGDVIGRSRVTSASARSGLAPAARAISPSGLPASGARRGEKGEDAARLSRFDECAANLRGGQGDCPPALNKANRVPDGFKCVRARSH